MEQGFQTALDRYGIPGVVLLAAGIIIWILFKREIAGRDSAEAEVKRLHNLILEQVLPTVHDATKAVADATRLAPALEDLLHELRRGERR